MNLIQLRYVKAVVETGSFTTAAEQCYVTQPTLSNGIAQLEQEFEQRLFTRTTRSVALTSFGEYILPFIDKVLSAQAELLHESRHFTRAAQRVVRIGISPLLQGGWLASMLEAFRAAHPDVEVVLHEQNMEELYRMLDERLLDFVFGIADARKSSWSGALLYNEPLYYIPRGKKPSVEGETVRFEDVSKDVFVMVPNGCGLTRATRALFRSHRRKLREYSGEALSYQVLEEWAALGLGAAILPKSKLQSPKRTAYALTDKQGHALTLDFVAVWLNTQKWQEHLQQFSEFLVDYGRACLPR